MTLWLWRQQFRLPRCGALLAACALLSAAAWSQPARSQEQNRAAARAQRKILVGPAAPAAQAAAAEDPDEAVVQQMMTQCRPVLNCELELIRQACDLPPEQRPRVKRAGLAGLRKYALAAKPAAAGFRVFGGEAESQDATLRAKLREALRAELTPEQAAKYAERIEQRAASRKRAVILCVVARLDAELYLTGEQRDKIADSLSAAWESRWEDWLSLLHFQPNFLPQLPDRCIVPHLNAEQAADYRGLQKINGRMSIFVQHNDDDSEPDAWWGSEPEKTGPAAGEVKPEQPAKAEVPNPAP